MLCACTKEAVLQQGKNVYLTCETERKRFSDHSPFAWKRSDAAPVCILAEGIAFGKSWWLPRLRKKA